MNAIRAGHGHGRRQSLSEEAAVGAAVPNWPLILLLLPVPPAEVGGAG